MFGDWWPTHLEIICDSCTHSLFINRKKNWDGIAQLPTDLITVFLTNAEHWLIQFSNQIHLLLRLNGDELKIWRCIWHLLVFIDMSDYVFDIFRHCVSNGINMPFIKIQALIIQWMCVSQLDAIFIIADTDSAHIQSSKRNHFCSVSDIYIFVHLVICSDVKVHWCIKIPIHQYLWSIFFPFLGWKLT